MSLVNDLDYTKFGKVILTPLIDIDNLDPTNGIIYTFESLWSLMTKGERIVYKDSEKTTKGERNKDISDRGRT